MKSTRILGLLVLLLALALVACGGNGDVPRACRCQQYGGDAGDAPPKRALPDLGGQEVTVAVENAYLPFNYMTRRRASRPGGITRSGTRSAAG